ncbi:phosphonate transport system permease protein [Alteribacillus persepolensis]|uniref:Phosphonate transport system permease protein n=1 Tax=Alteribacillus persepolensis TaxID=568899 RepID=A0A1G7YYP4_9BACI|nr:phosphonate ABC transporter, permease protein PhnE [Alteribacillus persepolensis]SDH01445.1 phosphonate transport system permease protein [Alteribacillus persepolensis]
MSWFRKRVWLYAVLLGLFTWWSMGKTEFEVSSFQEFSNAYSFIHDRFLPASWEILPTLIDPILVTLAVAFLGTFIALLIALPLSFAAAKNTAGNRLFYYFNRFFLSVLRSVPEIVFGLIFVVVLGLGPFPAVMAILLHNIGVLGKLISELIEAADAGPQEAMQSVGAGRRIGNLFSILPQIWPNVLSHYFYRFEVAIRTSLILGFIGGGGIGQKLFNDFNSFNYTAVTVEVLLIMLLVIIVDLFGAFVRKRVI